MLAAGCGAVCLVGLLRARFCLALVTGASMLPTLSPGDLLVVDKWAYRTVTPRRGDVVLARFRDELILKRIVGLPGEEVEVKAGRLHVNGTLIPEFYGTNDGCLDIERGRLLEGRFAALGDNRTAVPEVIVVAIVSQERILGRVVFPVPLWPSRLLESVWRHPFGGGAPVTTRGEAGSTEVLPQRPQILAAGILHVRVARVSILLEGSEALEAGLP